MKVFNGRDFTELEDGRLVFSREYLFARGVCCGSDCLNCPYKFDKEKKSENRQDLRPVISMVPSWTETLIKAGANVVGRTRFCIHPADRVQNIPALGGTKNLAPGYEESLNKILLEQKKSSSLKPLVVLDKEENPKEFATRFLEAGCEVLATEVTSLAKFQSELENLASLFSEKSIASADSVVTASVVEANLLGYADRLEKILQHNASEDISGHLSGLKTPTGFGEALIKDSHSKSSADLVETYRRLQDGEQQLTYIIWKSPWMCVGAGTFIESVLNWLFRGNKVLWTGKNQEPKYPEFDFSDVPPSTFFVYSSEPYPFEKEFARLPPGVLVDGEKISWFGIRAIRYLENVVGDLYTGPKVAYSDESKPI